jgi:hypothetical protein
MPWTVLTHPRGGTTGKVRKRYAVVQKLSLLEEAYCLRQESNVSLQGVAAVLGVRHSLLVKWMKDLAHLQSTPWSKKLSSYDGPKGQLHPIEHELLMFIFSQCEQGINVKHTLVCLKAPLLLLNTFGAKGYEACLRAIMRFMRKHNYMLRAKTNEATPVPQEVAQEVREFLEFTRPLLFGPHRNRRLISNMDQTPLHFSYPSSKTLEKRGTKMIHVRKTGNGTKRATGAFTITAAGNFLTPMIIYKGKPNGHITMRELPNSTRLPSTHARKPRGWMSSAC